MPAKPSPLFNHHLTEDGPVRGPVACIGLGVIGCGWATYLAGQGVNVRVWDPDPDAGRRLEQALEAAWPAMTELGLGTGASPDRITLCGSADAAVDGATFVQESSPERLDLKQQLLADLDRTVDPSALIASSTSGYRVSVLTPECRVAPERIIVGHPFNPVYLLPLVEVVGGPDTQSTTIDRAETFYSAIGKTVLRLEHEVDGFVADRLQEAMWREALHMVANGEATVEQLDLAITAGPGMRWALMGPMLTFHLAGGEGGMAHTLDHFGPSLQSPWTRLPAPEMTRELRDAVVEGCNAEARGKTISDLIEDRDRGLVAIIRALRAAGLAIPQEK